MNYAYPLSWPVGMPRTKYPSRSRFDTSESGARTNLENELTRLKATKIVITTNIELRGNGTPYARQNISDRGVAVYFDRDGQQQVMACDRWDKIGDNYQAIAKTIEALRGMDRWGVSDAVNAAFQGFAQIPASATSGTPIIPDQPWYDVLGVQPDAPAEVIEAAFKAKRKTAHPDAAGGSEDAFRRITQAYERYQSEA